MDNIEEETKKVKMKDTWREFKRTWPYARKYKRYMFLYGFILLIFMFINLATPFLTAKLVLNITNELLIKVLLVAGVILVLELSRNVFNYIGSVVYNRFYFFLLSDIQTSVIDETLKLEIEEIDSNTSGLFIDRLTKDVGELSEIVQRAMRFLGSIFTDVGVIVAIFVISKPLFLYCIISLFIVFWVERIRIQKWFKRMKEYRKMSEKNSGLISELVRGIRDIKVLNSTKDFMDKVMGKIRETNNDWMNINISQEKYTVASGSLKDLSNFFFIVFAIILIKTNHLTTDNLVVVYVYQSRMFNLLGSVTGFNEMLKRFTLASSRVFEIIDGKFKKEKFGKRHLNHIEGNFEFKNVYFSYDKKIPILKNLSFKIKANETVAFVGKSGGGKSTIFSLIDKMYDIDKGEILIDNINIDELDKDSIRNNISIITQSPYIFNFTIKENLKISKSNATDEEIIEACKVAQLHDFIMSLPKGYDTLVGEGGLTLSGGQRQRLAIARALLKQTEIILFDEATSALDNETQKGIQKAINNMKGTYTILIIAHRLSTVVDSDRLIVINDGKVDSEGSHEELLKSSKVYKELYENELE